MQASIGKVIGPGGFNRPAFARLSVRNGTVQLAKSSFPAAAMLLVSLYIAGYDLGGGTATHLACLAILVFGLPHGTLDLELFKRSRAGGAVPMPMLLILYLGLAGCMYLLWQAAPTVALCAFLLIAIIHFAEDWREVGTPFLAQGMAIATLTAPTLRHLAELEDAFVALSGTEAARVVAQFMLLLAPASLAIATVTIVRLCQLGLRTQAVAATVTLAGIMLLPPVIGFALFFCIYHSPRHLRSAWWALSGTSSRSHVVAGLTAAAFAISAILFLLEARTDLTSQAIAASFMTLSVLTVPHMAVPMLLALFSANRSGRIL